MQKIYIVLVAIISMTCFIIKANQGNQETDQISPEDLKCWKACILHLMTDKKEENGYSKEKCEDILAKIITR